MPSFGPKNARLLVAGMAPGVKGANRTGRPFTGDFAGVLLFGTLLRFGFARGTYRADPDDGLALIDCRIANAVRCVPPANLPTPAETATCNRFLAGELAGLHEVRIILALGLLAHGAVLRALGLRQSHLKFTHGTFHTLPGGRILANSYHVSRYNTSTGRLTEAMFAEIVAAIKTHLASLPACIP